MITSINSNLYVETFTSDNNQLTAKVEDYRNYIVSRNHSNDQKLIENYKPRRLKFEDQIATSILTDGDCIFAFSTIFHREFFGSGVYRCLNRCYFDPDLRYWQHLEKKKNKNYQGNPRINIVTPVMIQHQLDVLDRYKMVFMSSEPWKPYWAKSYCRNLTEQTSVKWNDSQLLHPVCHKESSSCWQHIIWTGQFLLDEGLSYDEYKARSFKQH
jgi:hypothetical protein